MRNKAKEEKKQFIYRQIDYTPEQIADMNWTINIKGKVKFPTDNKTGAQIQKTGKWKIGIFRIGYHSGNMNYGWDTDDANANNARSPLRVATLGTNAEIIAAAYELSYEFTSIALADELISRNDDVELMVWYDFDEADDNSWTGVDKLDFRKYSTIEQILPANKNYRLRYEPPHLRLEYNERIPEAELQDWQKESGNLWRDHSETLTTSSGDKTVDLDFSNTNNF